MLKSRIAIPYSSVFIRLNCKYWSDDAEKRMRARMAKGQAAEARDPDPDLCATTSFGILVGSPSAEVAKLADALA